MITDTDSILSAAARMGMAHNNGAGADALIDSCIPAWGAAR